MSSTEWPRLESPLEELDHRLPAAELEVTHLRARLEQLEALELARAEQLDDLERNGTAHAVIDATDAGAPAPIDRTDHPLPEEGPDLDLSRAAALGRRVRITTEGIRSLGIGELAQVATLAGVSIGELRARSAAPGGETVIVAMALILARRLEPDATWEDAQRWRIEVMTAPAAADPTTSRASS